LRESDAACRLGDVLAIAVLEDTDQHGALLAAERVRAALKTVSTDALTISVGIACYPAHALDAPELVTRAGEALGIAKAGGWDRVATAAPPDSN
jgi:diguanylate cyclase (GGDEF)-like protein